jgi:hypothetical protein
MLAGHTAAASLVAKRVVGHVAIKADWVAASRGAVAVLVRARR